MKSVFVRAFIFFTLLVINSSWACTGMQLKAKDGSFVNGRTVEFGVPLDLSVLIVPRNYAFKGTLPDGSAGLAYQAKYAAVGGSTFSEPAIVDGVNEKGLAVGMFYFPGYASYATLNDQNKSHALSPTEFNNWLLTQFATVAEVKAALNTVVIAPTTPKGWPGIPPMHFVVYDKMGNSLVIEPLQGELKAYDNPLGVFTNSPTFDWHVTNLANYINLSPINAPPKDIDGVKIKQFGEGSGLHGLPGDFTPPARFVRAAIFSSSAIPSDNSEQAVLQLFHILNQFDIPVGAVRDVQGNTTTPEMTIATTVKDPQNAKYYYRTYEDQNIKMVNLNAFDLDGKDLKTLPMKGNTPIEDVSKLGR